MEHKTQLQDIGFTIISDIYSDDEVEQVLATIEQVDKSKETFRKSADLFAIQQTFSNKIQIIKLN